MVDYADIMVLENWTRAKMYYDKQCVPTASSKIGKVLLK